MSSRYRPCRAGIFNIWQFDEQVYDFRGGRLVLRGQNGSGKTKSLELLFPLLYDADPDPDPARPVRFERPQHARQPARERRRRRPLRLQLVGVRA